MNVALKSPKGAIGRLTALFAHYLPRLCRPFGRVS